MATEHEIGVNVQFSGNSLLNMGEESISPNSIISPPSFAVNQNNYAPTGIQGASVLRLTATAVVSVTGIEAPNTARWKKLIIFNVGGSNITLTDASASSVIANRFAMNGNLLLNPNEGAIFMYDQTSSRWRCLGRAI